MNRRDLIKALAGAGVAAAGAGAFYYRHSKAKALLANASASHSLTPGTSSGPSEAPPVRLFDATQPAGIDFRHNNGAFGRKYLPETLGPGCAFFDYDSDGWLDLLLVNGMGWPGHPHERSTMTLYRNNRNGTFSDVTKAAGLDIEMYGIGAAVGDYDNDGRPDLLITCYGQCRLFHNNGNGTFTEATKAAGLGGYSGLSTSAMWFDYDRDGHLDLLVANYVRWSPGADIYCSLDGHSKSYCTPEAYPGATCWLFRNRGDGTFEDVTGKAGLNDPTSKSLGLTLIDYDQDGWPDVFIANDTQPNKLYHNNGNGTFTERAVEAGVAFSEDGLARAGMGADAADYDNSGAPSLVVTNFSNQMIGLYHNEGNGYFADQAARSSVGLASRLTLGFGCFFFDADLDGLLDLLVVNGHIDPTISAMEPSIHYAEPPHLFHNESGGKFREITSQAGESFATPKVGRGAAYGDYDNDGDLDIVLTTNNGPAYLYRNDCNNRSIRFRIIGTRSNRDGIGANIHVWTPQGHRWLMVKSGSSYLSQSDRSATFGLGSQNAIDRARIEWPSGVRQELGRLEAGRTYVVEEGTGIIDDRRFSRPEQA